MEFFWKKGVSLHIKNDKGEELLALAVRLSNILNIFKLKMLFEFMITYISLEDRTEVVNLLERAVAREEKIQNLTKGDIKWFFSITFFLPILA